MEKSCYSSTDEAEFTTTDELQFNQDKQTLKQTLKQVYTLQKHKFGEYNHVLLTDREKERLVSEYGSDMFQKCIIKLDEYIEMKGYKAKNHNLCIRKWVIRAVQDDEAKKGGKQTYGEAYDTGNCYTTDYYKQFKQTD